MDKKTNIDREVYFSEHANDELDKHNKVQEFALDIMQKGKEALISKRMRNFEAHRSIGEKTWIVSFVRQDKEVVVIHVAPRAR